MYTVVCQLGINRGGRTHFERILIRGACRATEGTRAKDDAIQTEEW